MKVLLAHPGTQHAPVLARELDRRKVLGAFWTGFAFRRESWIGRAMEIPLRSPKLKSLRNRAIDGLQIGQLKTMPTLELRSLLQNRLGGDPVEAIHERNLRFQQSIPEADLRACDAVIGFDTSSWILAERCQRLGKPLWMERTINHPRQWHGEQETLHRRYPQWQAAPSPRLPALVAAEEKEHDLAHRILVGSSFVARTLESMGVDPKKTVVNPYGVSWEAFKSPGPGGCAAAREPGPVRFLFAGLIGARKGVPVLLDAWARLGFGEREAELWLVGHAPEQLRRLIPSKAGIRVLGRVAKADMGAIYRQCDIFVLPSYSEGFPLVLLEALAAGLPVITTPNTGAGDLRDHGASDCVALVEAGSVEALADAMRAWKDCPPGQDVMRAACDKLRRHYSWEAYGDRWEKLLKRG